MIAKRKHACPISRRSCRDCALYRAKHYFHCHPDIPWNSVFSNPAREAETSLEGRTPWYESFFSGPPPAGLEPPRIRELAPDIDLDYWPEEESTGPGPAQVGPTHFAIDVWCGTCTLLLMEGSADGKPGWTPHRTALDIPEGLLAEAVLECGGSLHFAGTFPPNDKVVDLIRERLCFDNPS